MMEAQRALLDELMGTARNLTAEEKKAHREIKWDDKEVCGCYLAKFCPHELFVNTKSDLGPCPKIHDPKLKESYEQSTRHDLYVSRFEAELFQFCEKLVQDLDRKVRRGRERLAHDIDTSSLIPISTDKSDQLVNIEESIKKFLEEIEAFGEEGKVDEAEALMKKVDVLNVEKTIMTQQISNERGLILSQEQKMALCETCGSFLVVNDASERTQSHMTGKQHVGFGLVREYVIEYQAQKKKAREEECEVREKDDFISMSHKNGGIEKDPKERKQFAHEKEQNQDRGRNRKVVHRYNYNKNGRPSPKRVPVRDQLGDSKRNRVFHNKQEYDDETNSKKCGRLNWNQFHHRQLNRTPQSPPNSIVHNHSVAALNCHIQHRSRSPDHSD